MGKIVEKWNTERGVEILKYERGIVGIEGS
jgi:hypothetical protein